MILKQNKFNGMDMFKERPKLTWAEGIRGLMGEKGLVEEDWNDRHNWRKKII
jgi:hypothetical protein